MQEVGGRHCSVPTAVRLCGVLGQGDDAGGLDEYVEGTAATLLCQAVTEAVLMVQR